MVSVAPPGTKATIRWIGRCGKSCACAATRPASSAPIRAHNRNSAAMTFSPLLRFFVSPLPTQVGLRRVGMRGEDAAVPPSGIRQDPIPHIIDAELPVVDLAMLGAPLLGGEDLQRLVLRS